MRMLALGLLGVSVLFAQQPSGPAPATPLAATTATPARKVLIAKTQDEFDAYQRAAQQPNLKLADTSAQDFAIRFPESELRASLFQTLMLKHQSANNADAALADAERVLLIDPQNVVALVTAANALSERSLPATQLGQQRLDQAMRFAERALEILDNGLNLPPQASPDEATRFRAALISLAHGSAGNIFLLRQDYASAEKHLTAAAEFDTAHNALTLYRLAVAQRLEKKYDQALTTIDQAVEAANQSHDLLMVDRVKQEKRALVKAAAHP